MKLVPAALLSSLLVACGSSQPCPQTAQTASSVSPGQLDPKVVEAISTFAGVEKVELYLDASGAITKVSVYHHDEAKVPDVVKKAAAAKFPGAKVRAYEYELYAGEGWVHEVEFELADKKECEVSVAADGKVRYVECTIPKAPDAVAKQVETLVPGGAVEEVETKTSDAGEELSVEVKQNGVMHYLRFKTSGELISRSVRVTTRIDVKK